MKNTHFRETKSFKDNSLPDRLLRPHQALDKLQERFFFTVKED